LSKQKLVYRNEETFNSQLFACSDLSNNQLSTIAADAFDGLRALTSL